ncbi:MAG: hypothetical protein B7Y39_16880 [Bdellovibrio sp. 28-41-41]|nr:MAG: hypothetical protein B7Y39_16880 [Bdellovibrio sp. 28-41-41]
MSNIKTLVLLFPLVALLISSSAFSDGFSSDGFMGNQCTTFYHKNFKKSLSKPPETVPGDGIWEKPSPYWPNATNRFFNNKDTRNLDQRYSRECFLFSFLGALESTHLNRHYNSRKIEFSAAYLVARKFQHVIGEIISNNQNGKGMYFKLDGGETYHAMKLVELYGLVSEDIWSPKIPMEKWDLYKIYSDITDEVNVIINNRNQNPNFYTEAKLAQEAQRIFRKVMGDYVGEWPRSFWYDGVHHTTDSFGRMYGIDRHGEVEIRYTNMNGPYQDSAQTNNLKNFINPLLNYHGFNGIHTPETTRAVFEAVKDALASNRMVLIDVDGYDSVIGHQFAITELEILPSGSVKAVRLKNSYTNWGAGGYAWYRPEAISKVLRRIWIVDVNSNIPAIKYNPPIN